MELRISTNKQNNMQSVNLETLNQTVDQSMGFSLSPIMLPCLTLSAAVCLSLSDALCLVCPVSLAPLHSCSVSHLHEELSAHSSSDESV